MLEALAEAIGTVVIEDVGRPREDDRSAKRFSRLQHRQIVRRRVIAGDDRADLPVPQKFLRLAAAAAPVERVASQRTQHTKRFQRLVSGQSYQPVAEGRLAGRLALQRLEMGWPAL